MSAAKRIEEDENVPANPSPTPAHTPGPWRVGSEYPAMSFAQVEKGAPNIGPSLAVEGRGAEICLVESPSAMHVDEECWANARLIAAAPDLLEALQNVLILLEAEGGEGRSHIFIKAARAALTRARGAS